MRRVALIDVGDLLADPLQLGLQLHHLGGDAGVLRLGADGVDLPVDLLDEELQAAPGWGVGTDQRTELVEVAGEPRQLLRHVHALGEERHLLREPRRVGGDSARQLGDARGEPVA